MSFVLTEFDKQRSHRPLMSTLLSDVDQLRSHKPIQLGTSEHPCSIYTIPPDADDEGRQWTSMTMMLNDHDFAMMREFDAASPDFNDIVGKHILCPSVDVHVSYRFTKFLDKERNRRDRGLLKLISHVNIIVVPMISNGTGTNGKREVHLQALVIADENRGTWMGTVSYTHLTLPTILLV